MSLRTCSMAGCNKAELCGVGPHNEPMCAEHFDAWLAGSKAALESALSALSEWRRG